MQKEILLDEKLFIGQGCHRTCYVHPEDNSSCIKILHCDDKKAQKQLKREINYQLLLKRRFPEQDVIPDYYGTVLTNKGLGYVFELVKDFDEKPSKDLSSYLQSEDFLTKYHERLANDLTIFKDKMFKYEIVTMKLHAVNILYQRLTEKEARLVIVDDIGASSLLPLEYHIGFFAKNRVKRKWKYFLDGIQKNNNKPYIKELIKEII